MKRKKEIGDLHMKGAQCAETSEKSFFRFLVFELLASKRFKMMRKKLDFLHKWQNLQERSGLI